jgi:hypothetical protein
LDANKVSHRIAEAETALVARARELFHSAGNNIEEEQAVDEAMNALHALRSALKCRPNAKNASQDLARLKSTGGHADDGCELHFGTSRQHETRNKRSQSHDCSLLEQGPAHRTGEIRFRLTKGTFVGDQTGSIGHDETLCLNPGWLPEL